LYGEKAEDSEDYGGTGVKISPRPGSNAQNTKKKKQAAQEYDKYPAAYLHGA
jgi:hypothetical protein